jgi:hypothetical protein
MLWSQPAMQRMCQGLARDSDAMNNYCMPNLWKSHNKGGLIKLFGIKLADTKPTELFSDTEFDRYPSLWQHHHQRTWAGAYIFILCGPFGIPRLPSAWTSPMVQPHLPTCGISSATKSKRLHNFPTLGKLCRESSLDARSQMPP